LPYFVSAIPVLGVELLRHEIEPKTGIDPLLANGSHGLAGRRDAAHSLAKRRITRIARRLYETLHPASGFRPASRHFHLISIQNTTIVATRIFEFPCGLPSPIGYALAFLLLLRYPAERCCN
jgi:hypothetical protein